MSQLHKFRRSAIHIGTITSRTRIATFLGARFPQFCTVAPNCFWVLTVEQYLTSPVWRPEFVDSSFGCWANLCTRVCHQLPNTILKKLRYKRPSTTTVETHCQTVNYICTTVKSCVTTMPMCLAWKTWNNLHAFIQSDQKVSVHLMIIIHKVTSS
jgi:hypothetical protein